MNFFDITLPSIPGKNIKFKIQDIKSIGFSRQAPRFKEDKTFLTKRFIDSFKNFQEKNDADESEAETKISLCCSCMTEKPADEFRYIVPETKKYLVPKYEEMKNYTPSEKK